MESIEWIQIPVEPVHVDFGLIALRIALIPLCSVPLSDLLTKFFSTDMPQCLKKKTTLGQIHSLFLKLFSMILNWHEPERDCILSKTNQEHFKAKPFFPKSTLVQYHIVKILKE